MKSFYTKSVKMSNLFKKNYAILGNHTDNRESHIKVMDGTVHSEIWAKA